MAGGNPTAWRGALPQQATRGAGHGRGPSSQGGGSPLGRAPPSGLVDGSPRRPASATGPWRHAAGPGCPGQPSPRAALGTSARRRGSAAAPCRTIHSATSPRPSRTSASAPRRAVRTTRDSTSDWVPSKTAQSVRRNPAKSGPRIRPMAARSCWGSSDVASDANRSTSVVTESPSRRATPRGRCWWPCASRPSARRASEEVECAVANDTGRSGQIASDHSACRTPPRWKAR